MGIPLRLRGAGSAIANVRASFVLECYRLGAPQYGHVSAVVGIRVPQYLQFTLATSLITTCGGGCEPKSILDSQGVEDGARGGMAGVGGCSGIVSMRLLRDEA